MPAIGGPVACSCSNSSVAWGSRRRRDSLVIAAFTAIATTANPVDPVLLGRSALRGLVGRRR